MYIWFQVILGGLEIQCILFYEGDTKVTAKVKRLVEPALLATTVDLLVTKKRKVMDASNIFLTPLKTVVLR